MSNRIHNPTTKSYYATRERSTSAGPKGSIIGKWSPNEAAGTASAIRSSAEKTNKQFDKTFKWLGGKDRK
jgi:hypothetical protein